MPQAIIVRLETHRSLLEASEKMVKFPRLPAIVEEPMCSLKGFTFTVPSYSIFRVEFLQGIYLRQNGRRAILMPTNRDLPLCPIGGILRSLVVLQRPIHGELNLYAASLHPLSPFEFKVLPIQIHSSLVIILIVDPNVSVHRFTPISGEHVSAKYSLTSRTYQGNRSLQPRLRWLRSAKALAQTVYRSYRR